MFHRLAQLLLICVLWIAPIVQSQVPYDPSPFNIIGTINGMSLDAGGPLAGGSITVDGLNIVVPKNLLATLPAIAVAWSELFNNGVANLPGSISWEANVIGNRVGGKFIAGMVFIAQRATQTVQGFITAIDLSTGHFTVNGVTDCVINDPVGRYGRPYTANPLWSSDPDNPSIHAQTGFPVCIPRSASDPLCPSKNRPIDLTGAPLTQFTFKDPSTISSTEPDARLMAPLLVGDYVTLTGTYIGGRLEVNNLNVNLQFLTAPGTKPSYLWVEEAIYAVVTNQGGEIGETRAVMWTSDPTTPISWFAMDVDPCTGAVSERQLAFMQPTSGAAPVGKSVFRLAKVDASPATRQVGFRSSIGTSLTANNLTAGQYIQPIFDYTFPELINFGAPMFPNLFDVIPYLARGGGPYVPGTFGYPVPATPVVVGQLSPWPGAAAPAATSCAPLPPPTSTTSLFSTSTTDSSSSSETSVSTTLSTSTTSSAPPTSTSPVPKDVITILSAVQTQQRGVRTVTATASSNNPNALLSMAVAGQNPVGATPMTKSGTTFTLSISLKNQGTSVTITSQFGGSATVAI